MKQYEGELYNKNRFKCDFCGEEKEVGEDGVLHCGPCSFSLCMKCVDEFNRKWEEEEELMTAIKE